MSKTELVILLVIRYFCNVTLLPNSSTPKQLFAGGYSSDNILIEAKCDTIKSLTIIFEKQILYVKNNSI